jgi:hypothetical protein
VPSNPVSPLCPPPAYRNRSLPASELSLASDLNLSQVLEIARAKAAELEDFTAPEAAEGAKGAGGKRKRGEVDEQTAGAARARRFLADFATLPLPQLSPTEVGFHPVAAFSLVREEKCEDMS